MVETADYRANAPLKNTASLRSALICKENEGQQKARTAKNDMEENVKKVGLKIEEAADQRRWREGVSDCGRDEVYPATFGDEKTGYDDDEMELQLS